MLICYAIRADADAAAFDMFAAMMLTYADAAADMPCRYMMPAH